MSQYEFYITCAIAYRQKGNEKLYLRYRKLADELSIEQAALKRW